MQEGNIKFREEPEERDDLDFSKKVLCPHCKKPIPHDSILCLFCGEEVHNPKSHSWVSWVAIAMVVVIVMLIITR